MYVWKTYRFTKIHLKKKSMIINQSEMLFNQINNVIVIHFIFFYNLYTWTMDIGHTISVFESINLSVYLDQYHSWFYYKPPPQNFKMLKYLKKVNLLKTWHYKAQVQSINQCIWVNQSISVFESINQSVYLSQSINQSVHSPLMQHYIL